MRILENLQAHNDNIAEISFFDVKELYEAAYAAKEKTEGDLGMFQALLSEAERLDQAYRAQLAMAQPFNYTHMHAPVEMRAA